MAEEAAESVVSYSCQQAIYLSMTRTIETLRVRDETRPESKEEPVSDAVLRRSGGGDDRRLATA